MLHLSHDGPILSSYNLCPPPPPPRTADVPDAPIPVKDFPEHVKNLHSDDDYRFSEEYKVWLWEGEKGRVDLYTLCALHKLGVGGEGSRVSGVCSCTSICCSLLHPRTWSQTTVPLLRPSATQPMHRRTDTATSHAVSTVLLPFMQALQCVVTPPLPAPPLR